MDDNTLSICISIGIGLIAIAIGIFFGLRGFSTGVGNRFESGKTEVVGKLSNIENKLEKIDTTTNNIFQLAGILAKGFSGTIVLELKNFGTTKVTAVPGETTTTYTIEVSTGMLQSKLIDKLSKGTKFESNEIELFGQMTSVTSLTNNVLLVTIPSIDAKKCTKYMNMFLKWLDDEYARLQKQTVDDFENGISIS